MQDRITSSKVIDYVVRPALTGGVALLAARMLSSNADAFVEIFGKSISVPVLFGVAIATSSSVSELSYDFLIPQISKADRLNDWLGLTLGPAVSGGSLVAIGYALSGKIIWTNFLIGAGAEILSQYSWPTIEKSFLGFDSSE